MNKQETQWYPDSPDGNCEDSDSMHDCSYPTSWIHDCGDKCHRPFSNGLNLTIAAVVAHAHVAAIA